MRTDDLSLPDDMDLLKAMVRTMAEKTSALEDEHAELKARNLYADARIKRLMQILKAYDRARFGRRSEKLGSAGAGADEDAQQSFVFEEIETGIAALKAQTGQGRASGEKGTPRPSKGFRPHLDRVELVIEPEDLPEHVGREKVLIGEDISERLDVIPAKLRVIVTRRPKYGFKDADDVIQALAPAHIIESGLPTEALLAQIAVSKYADGLPLFRQEGISARDGVEIDRRLMAQWMGRVGFELEILAAHVMGEILKGPRIFADETSLPTLAPGTGSVKKAWLWAYARDDSTFGGSGPPMVACRFEDSRSGECVRRHLGGYRGILQVDGYAAYNQLVRKDGGNDGPRLAGCWAEAVWKHPDVVCFLRYGGASMSGFIEGVDREQISLFPDRLEDWIDEDHLVRVVDLFVDQLDLADLGFVRAAPARTGRPGYHPSVLLKLFIYGYLNRIPSSRRLEREAGRNVEVMWLLGRLVPDHKTIADFRRDNGAAIRKTCAQFVELCRRIGTLKGECVAIDGSKFKAVNNRDKNFTKGEIASRLAHLEADVERYITEMVRIDRQEEGEARAEKVVHVAQRYGRIKQEIAKLQAMGKALADAPDGQISLTDPDARAMATSARNSGLVGYNAQCAVDTETHIIVAHDVTNKGFDRDQLSPMALAARAALGRDKLHALADKGYFSGAEIAACDKAGITVTMPRPETSGNRKKGMYVKADFKYDADHDVYICPTGDTLTYRYTREEDGLLVRRYWTNECQSCPVKSRCTTGNERRVTRWEYEHLVDEMRDRLRSADDPMTLRRSTVEHPFGTIKAWMGATHFLMRRLRNVRTEMALNVLAYNIKRLVALVGIKRLMAAIPA